MKVTIKSDDLKELAKLISFDNKLPFNKYQIARYFLDVWVDRNLIEYFLDKTEKSYIFVLELLEDLIKRWNILEILENISKLIEIKDQDNSEKIQKIIRKYKFIQNTPEEKQFIDLSLLEKFLNLCDEYELGEYLILPILKEMWFYNVHYYWKTFKTDKWIDFYPVKYKFSFDDEIIFGIQLKIWNITIGDTSKDYKEISEIIKWLINEIETASETSKTKRTNTNQWYLGRLDWLIIITSWNKDIEIDEKIINKIDTKCWLFNFIRVYDWKDIKSWCEEYPLPVNIINKIKEIVEEKKKLIKKEMEKRWKPKKKK